MKVLAKLCGFASFTGEHFQGNWAKLMSSTEGIPKYPLVQV